MFRKKVLSLDEVMQKVLRESGLETPLQHKRLIDAWGSVVGNVVESYSGERFIKNQTLFVKINNPSLRNDLSMMRSQLVKRLNASVGAVVITDVKLF